MRAFQLLSQGTPGKFALNDVPEPEPGSGEVVVRVRACGLNRLDLWLEEGGLPIPQQLPRTPGGEIAGEVLKVGSQIQGWSVGDRVAVQSNLFCGECEFCARGEESLCLNGRLLGVQEDGGFAEMVRVPARALVRLPGSVDYLTSASLTLSGSTAMHMLTDRARVKPGDWVLAVGGSGGVGSAAIQIARGLGARVISTGSTPEKREFARRLGAECVVDATSPTWAGEVRKATGKRGVDLVVEHVGGELLEQAFQCLSRGGTIVTCGATAGREPRLNLWPFFVKQLKLIGSYGRNRSDMAETLKWAAAGKLKATIYRTLRLSEAALAFTLLRDRAVLKKIVMTP